MLYGIPILRASLSRFTQPSKRLFLIFPACNRGSEALLLNPSPVAKAYGTPALSRNTGSLSSGSSTLLPVSGEQLSLPTREEVVKRVFRILSSHDDVPEICENIRNDTDVFQYLIDQHRTADLIQCMAPKHPSYMGKLLEVAHEIGCPMKVNAYECAAFHQGQYGMWPLVSSTIALAYLHGQKPSTRLLNWKLRLSVELRQFSAVDAILAEFHDNGRELNRTSFHTLIHSHLRNHNLSQVAAVLRRMTESGATPDSSTYALIASKYRPLGRNVDVQNRALASLADVDDRAATAALNALLQHQLDADDMQAALSLLSFFRTDLVEPIMSTLLAIDANLKPPIRFQTSTLIPNSNTFCLFLAQLGMRRDLNGVLLIDEHMKSVGIAPTNRSVGAVMHACFAAGRPVAAVRIASQMSRPELSDLFLPYLVTDDRHPLSYVPPDVEPNTEIFNILLSGLLPTHGLSCVPRILGLMHGHQVSPDQKTLSLILGHLNKVQHTPPHTLLRILRAFHSSVPTHNIHHLHLIISSAIRRERNMLFGIGWNAKSAPFTRGPWFTPRVPRHLPILRQRHAFEPTAGLYIMSKSQPSAVAESIISSLSSLGVRSDPPMFALRIGQEAEMRQDIDTARHVFHEMVSRGMRPNEYHFAALMLGCTRQGNMQAAIQTMQSAVRSGVKPNVVMFTILITGYARQGKPDKAVSVFQEMVAARIQPDVPAIDAVASAFFTIGAYNTARLTLITLWAYIQPFPESLRPLSLKDLSIHFRSLRGRDPNKLSNKERTRVYRTMNAVRKTWARSFR